MATLKPQASLFDAPASSPIEAAVNWIGAVLIGELAVGLCVLAVAFVGFLMMSGRVPIKTGMRVAIGCFVILGAPSIAVGFLRVWEPSSPRAASTSPIAANPPPAREPPRADYDPYAGASVRTDR
ncbi:MAG: hypothetical protein CL953_06955 [Erythrobacteraceae bacterium]|nr:hypothetical protein [Citromicrobium sp.]MAS85580.1 hypothetical protein [Erythrobacteraceae bacterium]MBT47396.1 hypothetical protein [Citromicrobium sp.]|tara:strand:- start:10435 stop:10809 length:375 start_codon:yes stop_codon:yes gene_type:complete